MVWRQVLSVDKQLSDARHDADHTHDKDDSGKDAVEQPHRTDIEMSAHLVDKVSDAKPPRYSPEEYRNIAGYIVVGFKFGRTEIESGEKTDDEEQYQRIGEREEKPCPEILPIAVGLHRSRLEATRRIGDEEIAGIDAQNDRTYDLQRNLVSLDEIRDKRQAQPRQQTVDQVAQSRTDPGKKRRPTSAVKRPLDTQHPDRPHRCRHEDAYEQSAKYYNG